MTTPRWSLPVDLADPEDVQAKLPTAERIVEEIETELQRMRGVVDVLRSMARTVEAVAPAGSSTAGGPMPATDTTAASRDAAREDSPRAEGAGRAQLQGLVVDALTRAGGPTRSRDLRDKLAAEGHDLTADSVSNALWYAADRGTIRKVGRGIYMPVMFDTYVLESGIQLSVRDENEAEEARIQEMAGHN